MCVNTWPLTSCHHLWTPSEWPLHQNGVYSRAPNVISDFEKRRSVQTQIRQRHIVVAAAYID